jgi:hypothetical protein
MHDLCEAMGQARMENKEGPWLNDWSRHDLYDKIAAS